jgi:4-amino-4-deoxy-L-arabinose transferase-like glycosyltransferase
MNQFLRRHWLLLLVITFLLKGFFIASIGTPWYGEDEPSHFGYIEALSRSGKWFLFEDNLASVEMRMAHRWWDVASNRDLVLYRLQTDYKGSYRELASDHQNATAYQPPLYYYLMSLIYRQLSSLDMISILYLLRWVMVLLGAGYILVVYKILSLVFKEAAAVFTGTFLIAFLPLLGLLTATVSVQPFVYLLYALFIYFLLKADQGSGRWYLLALAITLAGLLTQQALLATPVILVIYLLYQWFRGKLPIKVLGALLLLLLIGVAAVSPQLYRRHEVTDYTPSERREPLRYWDWKHYLPAEGERLRIELIDNFWHQNRSMLPYYSAPKIIKGLTLVIYLAVVGIGVKIVSLNRQQLGRRLYRPLSVLGLSLLSIFVAGHLWFDYFQTQYSGQEYFKARYIFPLLPLVAIGLILGLYSLFRKQWLSIMLLMLIWLLLIGQATAATWLMLTLAWR